MVLFRLKLIALPPLVFSTSSLPNIESWSAVISPQPHKDCWAFAVLAGQRGGWQLFADSCSPDSPGWFVLHQSLTIAIPEFPASSEFDFPIRTGYLHSG